MGLIFPWKYAGLLLLGLLLGAGAGWRAQLLRSDAKIAALQSKWDAERAAQAVAARAAEAEARRVEQARQTEIEKVTQDAHAQIDHANAAAAAAERTAGELRRDLAVFVARHRAAVDSGAADRGAGEPGAGALDLLAELLKRADGAAGELAGYADRLRVAGSACERAYESVRAAR